MTFRIATARIALISMMAVGLPIVGAQAGPRDHETTRSHSKVCGSIDNPSLRCQMQDGVEMPAAQPAPARNWTSSTDEMPPSGGSGVPAYMMFNYRPGGQHR